jgi:FG-GAP repeat protein
MKTKKQRIWKMIIVVAATLAVSFAAEAQPGASYITQLSSLPPAAQASISAALGRDDTNYLMRQTATGFKSQNPRHGLDATFTRNNVEIRQGVAHWRLAFTGYGYGEALKTVRNAMPSRNANRVEYRRGELTEWYVNGPVGLEQGFTLSEPPAKKRGGPLTIAFTLSGNVRAAVDPGGSALTLTENNNQATLRYAGLAAHDAAGNTLRAWMEQRGARLLLRVDDTGARYPVVVDPWVQQAKLTAPDGANMDKFGFSVAISGDTAVVGAPLAKVGSYIYQGAAYVFVKSAAGAWDYMAKLTASDGSPYATFGESTTISGDTIVVGATNAVEATNGGFSTITGAAYVFIKPTTGWAGIMTETAKLTASDGAYSDWFGASVAISGDTVVVGARAANFQLDAFTPGPGAAYLFNKPAAGWANMTETAKLTASDGKAWDGFGKSVAISGETVVVGAVVPPFSGGPSPSPHPAYLFNKPAAGWVNMTETAKLSASDVASTDLFGQSVAISDDTVVVGSAEWAWGTPPPGPGAAYVFVKPVGGWTGMIQTAKLTALDGLPYNDFGVSVAISGDSIVVGDIIGTQLGTGAAYVFIKPAGGWTDMNQTTKLTASDGAANDAFGASVAVNGDTALVGAFAVNGVQGAAYVFQATAQTGAIGSGSWQNKNGQDQIKNSSSTAGVCNLTPWLRQYAPFQDLSAAASCSAVATYVSNVIKSANASGSSMNAMLKSQMLSTALSLYFNTSIGSVAIDLTKICTMMTSAGACGAYGNVSAAFGGAVNLTISQMLIYAASQSNVGGSLWYGNVKSVQELAKDAFEAINNQTAFMP